MSKYKQVVGILYNGIDVRVFLNNSELPDAAPMLQNKTYYLSLFTKNVIDKQRIYNLTKKINDCLHIDFGIKNLYHRMIFTACALVGKKIWCHSYKRNGLYADEKFHPQHIIKIFGG